MVPGLCNLLRYIQGDCCGVHKLEEDKFLTENNLGIYCHMEPRSCAQDYAGNYRGGLGMQRDAELALQWQGKVC